MSRVSNGPKLTDNGPALNDLRALGYTRCERLTNGVRDGYSLADPTGRRVAFKIQKRNGSEKAAGQHSFGVCHLDFVNVESFVFWVRGLDRVLIVPCARLTEAFRECSHSNRFANPRQWEVVFHFADDQVFLEPFGSGRRFDISACAFRPRRA